MSHQLSGGDETFASLYERVEIDHARDDINHKTLREVGHVEQHILIPEVDTIIHIVRVGIGHTLEEQLMTELIVEDEGHILADRSHEQLVRSRYAAYEDVVGRRLEGIVDARDSELDMIYTHVTVLSSTDDVESLKLPVEQLDDDFETCGADIHDLMSMQMVNKIMNGIKNGEYQLQVA